MHQDYKRNKALKGICACIDLFMLERGKNYSSVKANYG